MSVSLVVLAAGLSTRYGRLKQLDPVGPSGEALMDYGIFDAVRAGVARVVPVVREGIAGAVGRHVRALVGRSAEVACALQALDDVPAWFDVPEAREKPWGTGHAVLAARRVLDGPFLVMNADDFYGREALGRLVAWARDGSAPGDAALVPYRLRDSLSPHGGVSRAILRVDGDGMLAGIREVFRIRERGPDAAAEGGRAADAGGGAGSTADAAPLVGEDREGRAVGLTGEEPFSANLWGFRRQALPLLAEGFESFLGERGRERGAEFLVADGLRPALRERRLRVRVLEPGGTWLGVTHGEDRPAVAARLREMVRVGTYPADLSAALGGAASGR